MGSNGSSGFGIGYVEDDSDVGSDTFRALLMGMQEEKGSKGSSGDLTDRSGLQRLSSSARPMPWTSAPSTPTAASLPLRASRAGQCGHCFLRTSGMGAHQQLGCPRLGCDLQSPPMSTFKACRTLRISYPPLR